MNIEDLNKYEGKIKKVRLEREFASGFDNGFIHYVNTEILILQQYHDFYCEGYCVLRLKDIIDVRSNKYERFFEVMFKEEGLLSKVIKPDIPTIKNMKELLEFFQKNETNIIIECEYENEDDDIFACGKVSEIEDGTLWVKEFDATGKWVKKELGIELDSVTNIQFDTPYLNIFTKHLLDITRQSTNV